MAKIKCYFKKLIEKFKNNKGFSLSEIIIAAGIISSVATLAGAQMDDVLPLARDAQRKANVHQTQAALNLYFDNHGEYPITGDSEPTVAGWQLIKNVLESAAEIYMPAVPRDPLNNGPYLFKYWSDGQKFMIAYETEDPLDQSPQIAWGL